MTLEQKFADEFGQDQAEAILEAAEGHRSTSIAKDRGSDTFKWALVICIDFNCWVKRDFRSFHRIKPSRLRIENWIIENANLEDYDGDIPPLSLSTGRYNKFVPEEEAS